MITLAYSVFDTKALIYNQPFFAPTDGAAIRLFSDLVNDNNTTVGRHPADYVLYAIGAYDDGKGLLTPQVPMRHIMDAVALVKVQPNLFDPPAQIDPERLKKQMQNGEAK